MSGSLSSHRPTIAEVNAIRDIMGGYFADYNLYLTGSASYMNNTDYGDVDFILSPYPWARDYTLKEAEDRLRLLFGANKNGSARTSGIIGRTQVDIFFAEERYLGATRVFYGLPTNLQIALRIIARAKGYSFGPHGIINLATNEVESTLNVHDVYQLFGVLEFTDEQKCAARGYKITEPKHIFVEEA